MSRSLVPLLCGLALGFAPAAVGAVVQSRGTSDDFVSTVGARVVARCDLGVLGVVRRISVFRGSVIAGVEVERVLYGKGGPATGTEILVLAGRPHYFGGVGTRIVLFLVALRPYPQYRAVSRITLDTPLGKRRFEVLDEVLQIERAESSAFAKARRLKELFFPLLAQDLPEIRLLALRELTELTARHPAVFRRRDLDRLRVLQLARLVPEARPYVEQMSARLERLPDRQGARVDLHRRAIRAAAGTKEGTEAMASAVRELGPDAVGLLVEALSAEAPAMRELAAFHLGGLGDPFAVPVLLARFRREQDPAVRSAVLDALGQLRAVAAVDPARAALDSPELRRSAILALGRIGNEESLAALRAFRSSLEDSASPEQKEWLDLLDFVFSEQFRKQEAALRKLRSRDQ
jgi:hypothetical protein